MQIVKGSQEMPQSNNYKGFLKNSLNKGDLIRLFNEFVQLEVPCLHKDYPQVITLEKETSEISLTGFENLSPCNQEKVDTRNMYYCILEDKPTVVTDILILMAHVFRLIFLIMTGFYKPRKTSS